MRAALTMQHMLTANGNVRVEAENATTNANVRTNGSAQVNNGGNVFRGFLYHGQSINDAGIRSRLQAAFVPNANPSNEPKLQLTPAISIPQFQASSYRSYATRTTNGNLIQGGTITLGTLANPTIWYVSGDLILQGSPVTLKGFGVFLVQGNINISTTTTVTGAAAGTGGVAFLTSGTVNMNSPLTTSGYLLARGNININGNSTIYGPVTSAGTVNFNNGGRIVHRTPPSALLPMFPTTPSTPPRFQALSLRSS
jgi:hypothetical protein